MSSSSIVSPPPPPFVHISSVICGPIIMYDWGDNDEVHVGGFVIVIPEGGSYYCQ